ncbi:MAG: hypothetical protein HC820_01810 [Hydrococcus sp. RM1_1_31]|nr:hypothetical protein [Hydrococcus sp. RM1_1_31]
MHTGAIAKNAEKLVILSSVGIANDLQLISLVNNTVNANANKGLDFRLVLPDSDEFYKVSVVDLTHPFTFPFIAVRPTWQLESSRLRQLPMLLFLPG